MPHRVFVPAHAVGVSNKDNDYTPIPCMWDRAQKTQCLLKDAQGEVSKGLRFTIRCKHDQEVSSGEVTPHLGQL